MNPTPKGKIGLLPKPLRDEVNLRLENGQKARPLLATLIEQTAYGFALSEFVSCCRSGTNRRWPNSSLAAR